MSNRTVKVTRRKIEYYTEEVNLLDHLRKNVAEVYISRENECVEIRFPTRVEDLTHYVGHVPFECISESMNDIWQMLKDERHMEFLEKYVDDIVWKEGYQDVVTR